MSNEVKILLVDDHQMMREGLRKLITIQGEFKVVGEAASSQAALEQARVQKPDVVLLDIHLPDRNGIETARQLRAELPSVRIIILSSDSDPQVVLDALHSGVSGYVLKVNSSEDLGQAIRSVMAGQIFLSAEVSSIVVQDFLKSVDDSAIPFGRETLTEREKHLLKLVAEGKRNKEIADALDVGVKSVETYRSRLMKKLNCSGTAELTRYAIREGITVA